MELQVVHALYRNEQLIFADPQMRPQDGTKVLVTYLVQPHNTGRA